jgi:hypothetical protein
MHAMFFRSFYLIFAGLFVQLFVACSVAVLGAASAGDPLSTIAAVGLATVCAVLVKRAVSYWRG